MFSKYCDTKYEIQPCKVYSPDGTYELYPGLEYRDEMINVDKANNYIGIKYVSHLPGNINENYNTYLLTPSVGL